ncbi:hypothetical protein LOTGIDRAFT_164298 [Lottia gigantea]|uniref:DNA-directed DNA polymerase n=1 Tax=Lottia gigantea TaxID=225164 RepID=V4AAQ8_LOTGI|nr:hypothetical protein LOTGIDRAFT_164298 [Lottia gigantea]ESO90371.1 hypothetical protein LOTGIDRAFT_164298 [Lottia gigantea]
MNLRKITDINIAKYTEDNWESLRHEWEPYAKRDTLCLGACMIKYNKVMKEVVFQNISNNLTAPSLSLRGWCYLYHYDKEMVEEEWYETTRMVPKHTEKENVEKVYSHTHPFIRHFIRQSIKGGRVSANRKSFETNKMDEICNVLKEFSETRSDNIIDLFKEYSKSNKDKTEVNSKLKKIKCTKLMAFDANGLYASAMSDLDSEYPKAESGRPFLPEEYKEFKDITTSRHLLSEPTLKSNFDSHVKNYPKENEAKYIVGINEEEKEFDCIPPKSTRLTPSHLGSFVLSQSKKIMNNFIHVIDGFYKPEIYYTYTDSLYISSRNWDKLNEAGLVSENEHCKGKNDYGDGGIMYGLYSSQIQYQSNFRRYSKRKENV